MDSAPWISLALFALALAGAYYLLLPLVVLWSQRMRADAEIVSFDPSITPPPSWVSDYFGAADSRLSAIGFRRLASLALPNPMANTSAVIQIYVNEESNDAALVSAVIGGPPAAPAAIRVHYLEFITRFRGSPRLVETNNSSIVSAFGRPPQKMAFRFPHVQDVVRLYKLHQTLLRNHAAGLIKTLRVLEEFRGDAVAYLRQAVFLEEFQGQEAIGYLRRDANANSWRPNLEGCVPYGLETTMAGETDTAGTHKA